MPIPNGGLITETNEQYYAGAQRFLSAGGVTITTTFNTDLVFSTSNTALPEYALNNFQIYTSANNNPGSYTEYTGTYTVANNKITFAAAPAAGGFI
jgi:hypothetical protein